VEANRNQLARSAPFDLRRPYGIRHGWRASRARHENAGQVHSGYASVGVSDVARPDDIDPGEVTEALLYAAVFLGLLLLVAVGAAVIFGLRALQHW
jgi:hypothetical protein